MAHNIFVAARSAFILPSTHSDRNVTFQDNYLPGRVKDGGTEMMGRTELLELSSIVG